MLALTTPEIALRIALAFVAGGLVGLERETRGRAAGFRTTLLVCVAAALAMIISQMLFVRSFTDSWRPDPARLAAGVLAGMGFLGAGSIVRETTFVRGVTTAATLWFSSIMGMAFGIGEPTLGFIALGVALFTLYVLPSVESRVPVQWFSKIIVTLDTSAMSDQEIKQRIESFGVEIKNFELEYDMLKKVKTVSCEIKCVRSQRFDLSQKVVADLAGCAGVSQVKWL